MPKVPLTRPRFRQFFQDRATGSAAIGESTYYCIGHKTKFEATELIRRISKNAPGGTNKNTNPVSCYSRILSTKASKVSTSQSCRSPNSIYSAQP